MTEHPLTAFLRARWDEREQAARAAKPGVNPLRGEWSFADMQVRDDAGHLVVKHTWPNEGEHIALNDPAFVLADIASKRKIIELYERAVTVPTSRLSSFVRGQDDGFRQACIEALKLLAEPFASHPDYPKDQP